MLHISTLEFWVLSYLGVRSFTATLNTYTFRAPRASPNNHLTWVMFRLLECRNTLVHVSSQSYRCYVDVLVLHGTQAKVFLDLALTSTCELGYS